MAEVTAERAVEWLTSDKAFGQECYSRKQIAALIEQQAAEIAELQEKMHLQGNSLCHYYKENIELKQEIAKKDRMLERATWVLDRTGSCPKTCDLMRNLCAARACWLAWLEKECAGVE